MGTAKCTILCGPSLWIARRSIQNQFQFRCHSRKIMPMQGYFKREATLKGSPELSNQALNQACWSCSISHYYTFPIHAPITNCSSPHTRSVLHRSHKHLPKTATASHRHAPMLLSAYSMRSNRSADNLFERLASWPPYSWREVFQHFPAGEQAYCPTQSSAGANGGIVASQQLSNW